MKRLLTVVPFSRATLLASVAGLASLWATGAQAQSSVQVYGLIDLSAGQFQVAGAPKLKRLDSGNRNTSYLGFRGSEDLGDGLKAGFTLDGFLLADSGGAGRVPGVDPHWARNANLSLSGSFGLLRLGRMAPTMFVSTAQFNSWGASFGYSPSIRQYYSLPHGTPLVGDSGWSNAVAYSLPRLGGLSATVMLAAGEGAANARGANKGAHLVYSSGPMAFTAAYQKVEAQGALGRPISAFPGFSGQSAMQLGASYDLKFAKFFVQVGRIETEAIREVDTKNLQLSASVPLGTGALLAAWGRSETSTAGVAGKPESKILTLGYSYPLSKRTEIYAVGMRDQYTGKSSGTTLAVGMQHTF